MHYQSSCQLRRVYAKYFSSSIKVHKICLKLLVLPNININFQTNLLTLFVDLGWNKYFTHNVSVNASVAQINLKLFYFSIIFKGVVTFYLNIENVF